LGPLQVLPLQVEVGPQLAFYGELPLEAAAAILFLPSYQVSDLFSDQALLLVVDLCLVLAFVSPSLVLAIEV